MARPELPAAEKRDSYIMVRVTKEEKELVKQAAKAVMRSAADFSRLAVLREAGKALDS